MRLLIFLSEIAPPRDVIRFLKEVYRLAMTVSSPSDAIGLNLARETNNLIGRGASLGRAGREVVDGAASNPVPSRSSAGETVRPSVPCESGAPPICASCGYGTL
jgi:hypothetical protein